MRLREGGSKRGKVRWRKKGRTRGGRDGLRAARGGRKGNRKERMGDEGGREGGGKIRKGEKEIKKHDCESERCRIQDRMKCEFTTCSMCVS